MENEEKVRDIIKALIIHCGAFTNCKNCHYFDYGDCVEKLLHDIYDLLKQYKV